MRKGRLSARQDGDSGYDNVLPAMSGLSCLFALDVATNVRRVRLRARSRIIRASHAGVSGQDWNAINSTLDANFGAVASPDSQLLV